MIDDLIFNNFTNKLINIALEFDSTTIIYLVGSYANKSQTEKSDMDFLILNGKNKEFVIKLNKIIKSEFPSILNIIDCKVITGKDLIEYRNNNYLMLYSMIKNGKLIQGREISIKLSPTLLQREFTKLDDLKTQIGNLISEKRNFNTAGCILFNYGKTLYHLNKLILKDPVNLKEILGTNLSYLGRIYESETKQKKGLMTTLTMQITSSNKKSTGNFERLKKSLLELSEFQNKLKLEFDKKF